MTILLNQINPQIPSACIVGTNIDLLSFNQTIHQISDWAQRREPRYVCVANVHMLIEAHNDPEFADVLGHSDLVVPDGMPLVLAMHLLYKIRQERVAGMDLLPAILSHATLSSIPVYFYGSSEDILKRVVQRAHTEYSALKIAGVYSPPFRKLTKEENEAVIDIINLSGAKIVFVALGCPNQEKWMAYTNRKINAVMIGVGGAFPVYAGLQSRAPLWMQKCSLEWAYRLMQEPFRLYKRYLYTNSVFLFLLGKDLICARFLNKTRI